MPDQSRPSYPILGFVAGTPLLTPGDHKPIEELCPGDLIQTWPDDEPTDVHDAGCDCPDHDPRWWEKN